MNKSAVIIFSVIAAIVPEFAYSTETVPNSSFNLIGFAAGSWDGTDGIIDRAIL